MSADEITGPASEPLPEERNWSVGAHVGALVGNVFALGQISGEVLAEDLEEAESRVVGAGDHGARRILGDGPPRSTAVVPRRGRHLAFPYAGPRARG